MSGNTSLCPRCMGFYTGVVIFTLLIVIFHFYGMPDISTKIAKVFIIIAIISFMPAAFHGISRRYFGKDISPSASLIFLYISGFLTAFGGFLFGLALITLDPLDIYVYWMVRGIGRFSYLLPYSKSSHHTIYRLCHSNRTCSNLQLFYSYGSSFLQSAYL